MRPGRGIIAVLIVLAALGVSCKARTDAGKGSTTSGGTSDNGTTDNGTTNGGTTSGGTSDNGTTDNGTTNGGTTNGGTDVSGRWEGRMDIIEIHQVIVPKPPPTLYPGETTKVTTSCSLGGQVTVELTQDGSQTSLDGHGSANGAGCSRDGDIQGVGTVAGSQLTVTSLSLLGCTVSLTATIDGDSMTGSVTGTGALPPACRIQTGELQLHRTG